MNRGQAAVVDALFFMIICSVAATFMFYVSSLYGQSLNQEVSALYNYEFTGNALLSLMNANNQEFWLNLTNKLDQGSVKASEFRELVNKSGVWPDVMNASPSDYTFLCVEGSGCASFTPTLSDVCYPHNYTMESPCPSSCNGCECSATAFSTEEFTAYTRSTAIFEDCRAYMKVYY